MNWKPFFHATMIPPAYSSAEVSEGLEKEVWVAKYQTKFLNVLQAGYTTDINNPVLDIACGSELTNFLKLLEKTKKIIECNPPANPFAGIPYKTVGYDYNKDKVFVKALNKAYREASTKSYIAAKSSKPEVNTGKETAPQEEPTLIPPEPPVVATPLPALLNANEEEDITELPMSMDEFMAEIASKFDFKLNHRVVGGRKTEKKEYDLKINVTVHQGLVGVNGNSHGNRYRLLFGEYFLRNNLNFEFVTIGAGTVMDKPCLVALFDNPSFIGKVDNIRIRLDKKRRMREMSSFELIDKILRFFGIEYSKRIGAKTEVFLAVKPFKIKEKDAENKNFIITLLKTEKFNND